MGLTRRLSIRWRITIGSVLVAGLWSCCSGIVVISFALSFRNSVLA